MNTSWNQRAAFGLSTGDDRDQGAVASPRGTLASGGDNGRSSVSDLFRGWHSSDLSLKAGEWVEVLSKEEILRSLDANGKLEELPFMPQMFQYCGRRFKVYKRAHKTCDTVHPVRSRRLANAVHLDLRCDGKAYGGCQAACLLFWKEAWLRRVDGPASRSVSLSGGDRVPDAARPRVCSEEGVWRNTLAPDQRLDEEPRYSCQATLLPRFTTRLRWWHLGQYVEDYLSGNATAWSIFRGFVYSLYYNATQAYRPERAIFRTLYDRVQALWGGVPFPRRRGVLAVGQPSPTVTLDLKPGELVRVKSYEQILATLDTTNKNRGLLFEAELVPYCGGVYRVQARVERFLDEKTGKMQKMKTPAVILEGVWCRSRYSDCRMFCPRSIYSWWREAWLERVSE